MGRRLIGVICGTLGCAAAYELAVRLLLGSTLPLTTRVQKPWFVKAAILAEHFLQALIAGGVAALVVWGVSRRPWDALWSTAVAFVCNVAYCLRIWGEFYVEMAGTWLWLAMTLTDIVGLVTGVVWAACTLPRRAAESAEA